MKNTIKSISRDAFYVIGFSLILLLVAASHAGAQTAPVGGKLFATPDEAVEALISASETFDAAAFKEVLGPDSYDIVHSGEPVYDRQIAGEFAKLARAKKVLSPDKRNPRVVRLSVGEEDFPFPVPIVKKGTKWVFDVTAGRQEILYRRIGRNELTAIGICRGFVEAQHEYASQKRDGAAVNQYAQRIISTAGKQDGLSWRNADGTHGGPVGEEVAKAVDQGYSDKTAPYHGYYFRVLKGQGAAAPLGELDFVVKGHMIGGFALIAFPSQYQVTGVKTFMVSHDGVVYEKDLGLDTLELAKAIEIFNPDKTWSPVLDGN